MGYIKYKIVRIGSTNRVIRDEICTHKEYKLIRLVLSPVNPNTNGALNMSSRMKTLKTKHNLFFTVFWQEKRKIMR